MRRGQQNQYGSAGGGIPGPGGWGATPPPPGLGRLPYRHPPQLEVPPECRTPPPPSPGQPTRGPEKYPDALKVGIDRASAEDVARSLIFYTQDSPLSAQPFRGSPLLEEARLVIEPPADAADSDGESGATEMANAEAAASGLAVSTVQPATTGAYVEVLSFEVPNNRGITIKGLGVRAHDYWGSRDVIRWRLKVGTEVVVSEREIGLYGGLCNPIRIQNYSKDNTTVVLEARNLDTTSPTLVEAVLTGWTFPQLSAGDDFYSLIDPPPAAESLGRVE